MNEDARLGYLAGMHEKAIGSLEKRVDSVEKKVDRILVIVSRFEASWWILSRIGPLSRRVILALLGMGFGAALAGLIMGGGT